MKHLDPVSGMKQASKPPRIVGGVTWESFFSLAMGAWVRSLLLQVPCCLVPVTTYKSEGLSGWRKRNPSPLTFGIYLTRPTSCRR